VKARVIYNPQARGGQVGEAWAELEAQIRGAMPGAAIEVLRTERAEDVSRLAREGGFDRLVLVGGDGTLSEAAQGAVGTKLELALLPAGRGNDFFKSLNEAGSGNAWELGLRVLREGRARAIDVGRIRWLSKRGGPDRHFVNIASFGYPGLLVQKVHLRAGILGRSRLGKSSLAYLSQSLSSLREYRPVSVRVDVDGVRVFEGPVFSGLLLNGWFNAGGVRWSRDSSLDDGRLELLLQEPRGLLASAWSAPRMLSGNWQGAAGTHIHRGRRFRVVVPKPPSLNQQGLEGGSRRPPF
jgi:diacylglycerol kinase family enzyme